MNETDVHKYELVYVLQPNANQETINEFQNRIAQLIVDQQGEVTATEVWGKRNLAYAIENYGTGYYVLNRFKMRPAGSEELDRVLRINENVLRYLLMLDEE
jgi:small subunit ribosomal protein S6